MQLPKPTSLSNIMAITKRALDTIGDLIEAEEARIKEEMSDKPEWVAQEIDNELVEAWELLYDNVD